MPNKLDKLNTLISQRKDTTEANIGLLMSELGCFEGLVGAEYEVTDARGKLLARIHRKSLSPEQIGELMKALEAVTKIKYGKKK